MQYFFHPRSLLTSRKPMHTRKTSSNTTTATLARNSRHGQRPGHHQQEQQQQKRQLWQQQQQRQNPRRRRQRRRQRRKRRRLANRTWGCFSSASSSLLTVRRCPVRGSWQQNKLRTLDAHKNRPMHKQIHRMPKRTHADKRAAHCPPLLCARIVAAKQATHTGTWH